MAAVADIFNGTLAEGGSHGRSRCPGGLGIPTRGRERQALDLLGNSLTDYLETLSREGRIERFDAALLRPQSTELGGFILIQGTTEQIDALRTDRDFQTWVTQVQLVADEVGIVDSWVDDGLPAAYDLYEDALRKP